MSGCDGKYAWPELVGTNGKEAAAIIEKENEYVKAIVLQAGTPIPRDFRCDRVWVFVDYDGEVVSVPTVG